jgi:mannose-1-phosphate guanylyltransferase
MKAFLLLGGFGTRMRPFSISTPKALLPLANIPFIKYQLAHLKKYNVTEVILGVGYKGKEFKKIVDIAKKMGIKSYLSFEKEPLDTAGGIKNAEKFLKAKEPFLIFNGDILADFNLEKILNFHQEKNADVTIGMVKVEDPSAYGLIITEKDMKIKSFVEKPKGEQIIADTINAGVYVFNPDILEEIPAGKKVSVEKETFPALLDKNRAMYGYVHYGYWMDVGTLAKFKKANFDIMEGKVDILYEPSGKKAEIDETSVCAESANVEGKLLAGKNVIVEEGVTIKGKVIVNDGCLISRNSHLEDTIILKNSIIGQSSHISNSIIGQEVIIEENSVIKNTALADRSLIHSYTKTEV